MRAKIGTAVLLIVTLCCLELLSRVFVEHLLPGYEKARQILAGENFAESRFQNSVGIPYLLYSPTPNFRNEHGLQHNEHGYRGTMVSLERRTGFKRVLALGGSTTYGWKVKEATQSYPHHLSSMLSTNLPIGEKGVEVINAGLPWGTTAELLTHFHFKYRHYRPDVVIINTGGNDGYGQTYPNYQPDYNNWRRPLLPPRPLARIGRIVLKSRLATLFIMPLVHGIIPHQHTISNEEGDFRPRVDWYTKKSPTDDELAFSKNLDALIDMVEKEGAKVLLAPFRIAPDFGYAKPVTQQINRNEKILKKIAEKRKLTWIPFPASAISKENWMDDCHLNGKGAWEKARHFAPYVRKALWPNSPAIATTARNQADPYTDEGVLRLSQN